MEVGARRLGNYVAIIRLVDRVTCVSDPAEYGREGLCAWNDNLEPA